MPELPGVEFLSSKPQIAGFVKYSNKYNCKVNKVFLIYKL